MVNNQLVELFAAELFDELEAVELDEGADADAAARFAFANRREAKGFGQASTLLKINKLVSCNQHRYKF